MSDHLSPEQESRYLKRKLSPSDLFAVDDHIRECDPCRRRVSDSVDFQAISSLRTDLESEATRNPTHLSYEQLEAYVDRQLDDADREIVDAHIETCPICRSELMDLREFSGQHVDHTRELPIPPFAEPEPVFLAVPPVANMQAARSPQKRKKSFGLKFDRFWPLPQIIAATTAAAILILIFSALYFWYQPAVENAVGSNPNGVSELLDMPAELRALIGERETLLSTQNDSPSFDLLAPVGTFIEDLRPTFRWKPLPGTTQYQVKVFDTNLDQVEASPALQDTFWTSSHPLIRGRLYLWQVTAVRNGQQLVSPAPPFPEAKFKIIDTGQASALEALKRDHPESHYELGLAYARAGVLDQAEQELKQVQPSDPKYSMALKYIVQLGALRRSGHEK